MRHNSLLPYLSCVIFLLAYPSLSIQNPNTHKEQFDMPKAKMMGFWPNCREQRDNSTTMMRSYNLGLWSNHTSFLFFNLFYQIITSISSNWHKEYFIKNSKANQTKLQSTSYQNRQNHSAKQLLGEIYN